MNPVDINSSIIARTIEIEFELIKLGYGKDQAFRDYLIATKTGSFLCGDGLMVGEASIYLGVNVPKTFQVNIQGFLAPKATNSLVESLETRKLLGIAITPELMELGKILVEDQNNFVIAVTQKDEFLNTLAFLREAYGKKRKKGSGDYQDRVFQMSELPEEIQKAIKEFGSQGHIFSGEEEKRKQFVYLENHTSMVPEIFHKLVIETPELLPVLEKYATQMVAKLRKFAAVAESIT